MESLPQGSSSNVGDRMVTTESLGVRIGHEVPHGGEVTVSRPGVHASAEQCAAPSYGVGYQPVAPDTRLWRQTPAYGATTVPLARFFDGTNEMAPT